MNIGVDLDDTLIVFHQALITWWNETFGTALTLEDFTSPDINSACKVPLEEVMRRICLFDTTAAKKNLPPMAGAQDAVSRLALWHDLHLITNRPIEIRDETIEFVTRLFPRAFKGFHFCTKDWGTTKIRDKSLVCQDIDAKVIFEDHLGNAERCAALGVNAYIMDQPWNRHNLPKLPGKVIRVMSWNDPELLF